MFFDWKKQLEKLQLYHVFKSIIKYETEFACTYKNPLYKTQNLEKLVEFRLRFRYNHWKNKI